jgi:hypothetical protein
MDSGAIVSPVVSHHNWAHVKADCDLHGKTFTDPFVAGHGRRRLVRGFGS